MARLNGVQFLQPDNRIRKPDHVSDVQPGNNRLRRRTLSPYHHHRTERVCDMGTDQDVPGTVNRGLVMWRKLRFSLSRLDSLLFFSVLFLTIVQPHYYPMVREVVLAVSSPLLVIRQYHHLHRSVSSSARWKWLIRRSAKGQES